MISRCLEDCLGVIYTWPHKVMTSIIRRGWLVTTLKSQAHFCWSCREVVFLDLEFMLFCRTL